MLLDRAIAQDRLPEAWNDTGRPYPPGFVHEQVAAAARRRPEALAVASSGVGAERLSYGELEARSNRLAHRLAALGVGPESRVAVCMAQSPARVVAVLAVLKAGGAYVSLDPANPAERLAFQIADCGAAVVLTQEDLAERLPPRLAVVLTVDAMDELDEVAGGDDAPPAVRLDAANLAYVVYTSGSTGVPKGVEISHAGLWNLVAWHREQYAVTAADRATAVANPAFDAAVWEIWPYLTAGASLHVPAEAVRLSPERLARWWAEEGITLSFLPTPLAEAVLGEEMPPGLALRALLTGGDRLHRGPAPGAPFRLMNHYGPSESSVVTTVEEVRTAVEAASPDVAALPAIGRPIANLRVHVLGETGEPVPVGEPGELCVAGAGLARGYLARPDLTAAAFVPDPFAPAPGGRLYRTGDLARWRPEGKLDFLGRADRQVKVRGLRIELGEIEAVLARQPAVSAAAVLLREGRLVAYIAGQADAAGLRAALAERLPDYMVPAAFVALAALPLSPNGKVDRRALAALPPPAAEPQTAEVAAPRTPLEESLAAIWAELLGVPKVGRHDDFLALGGHSLLASRVLSRVRRAFGVELPLPAFFAAPTVAALARAVAGARGEEAPAAGLPLSYSQRRLWFLDRFTPGSHAYNVPLPLRVEGALAPAALAAALGEIVRRHEVLRTTYAAGKEDPWQVVHPAGVGAFALPLLDLAALPERHRRAEAQRLLDADAVRPFDLRAGPVLRTSLLRLRAEEHLLLFNVHHIAFDGWSTPILRRELAVLYGAAAAGQPSPLPEPPWQYSDFAAWQRSWLAGDDVAAQLAFWRQALAGAPDLLEIPADHPRPPAQSFRGETLQSHLPAGETAALGALARERGVTLFMLLLAAFQTLLHRYTGQDDLLIGTPVAGRERRETQGLIGFFVNTLALRADLAGDPMFGSLLARTRDLCLAAYSHQELPFEILVEELQPVRDLSRPPLVQVLLAMENARREVPQPSGPRFVPLEAEIRAAKLDLTLLAQEWDPVLALSFEYALDLFEPATVERLAAHLRSLLASAVASPGRRLSELPLLSPAERAEALKQAGLPGVLFPWTGCVHERFAARARETPEAVAAVYEGESLNYGELDERAGRLARRLRRLGVGPESRVGLFCERSLDMVTAILGVLKAGGAYVPLDPNYPAERVAFVLADAGIRVLLTSGELADRLPATDAAVLQLDERYEDELEPLLLVDVAPENAAYVIYTSGSTGQPKGVVISHREVARLMTATDGWYGFGADDVWTLFHSYAFDFSVWEIWGALVHGGRLVVVPWWVSREPEAFLDLLERERVTVLNQTPSSFRQLVLAESAGPVRDLALRLVIFGGEALEMASLAPWFARHGDQTPRLVNMYGITETTVHVTYRPVAAVDLKAASVIGVPIPDLQLHVLERGMQPAPLLVPGELHVGGAGLARGYLNRPELTAERFVPDPFGGRPGARLYRSGDLARRLPGGDLAYLGRIDQQVKIRGFRIELGEVEAALSSLPGVSEAVVLALADPAGGSRLVACVAGAQVPAGPELRALLKQRLPEHMVPAGFVTLPSLPLTPNGKVDRKALAGLETAPGREPGRDGAVTAPRTPVEQALAKIFAERLAAGPVGLESDFFDLGGHSLLAVRVIADVRQALGIELTVRALFEAPTVAGLARAVEIAREGGAGAAPAFTGVSRAAGRLPLSYSQRRLWFLDQFNPGSHAYNLLFPLRLAGDLDPAALAAALSEIVRRHEVLRTTYTAGERDPWQVVQPAAALPLPLVDLAALPAESREQESSRLAAADAARPFDLRAGPVFRAALVRLAAAEHVLLAGVHHIAFDGWSVGILLAELAALYGAGAAGRPSPLPEPPWQYADFAAWQRSTLSGEVLAEQTGFWRRALEGAPDFLELPADHPRPPVQSLRGGTLARALGPGTTADLRRLGRERGLSLFMLLLAGFQALLQRYTGAGDLVVGSPIAGRHRAETEELIGFFVNTLALRSDLAGNPSFGELLARVRESCLAAYAHQDLPFEILVEELRPGRDLSRSPLVQVVLVLQNAERETPQPQGLRLTLLEADVRSAKFDLTLGVTEADDDLALSFEYATDLFEPATVERMAGHLRGFLTAAAADPERRLAELPLLSPAERAEALAQAGDPAVDFPWTGCVHERFAAWARRTPAAVAAVHEGESLTYGELDERAERLARRLRRLGVGPESRVGLFCERSLSLVTAILGVLKAGGAYVPLDPNYPADRVAFVLADAGIRVLLTGGEVADRLPAAAVTATVLRLDERGEDDDDPMPPVEVDPDNAAYVIYTSGSTGQPKGVVISHREVARLMTATEAWYGFGPEDVWTLFHSYAFDFSVWEIWGALVHGGRLVVVPWWVSRDPEAFLALLESEGVTVLNQTPSAFRQLALMESSTEGRDFALRYVIFGGEALEMASLEPWFARHSDERPRLVNMYGITETTVHVTYRPVSAVDLKAASVIGVPIPDLQVHVLEPGMEPAPLLVPGELHIGGAGLARGYLNRPELTAERFVPDPFGGRPGARLYRSGDLARRLPGGDLAYLGRIDQQVKIRGFRIELGEVEAALSSLPGVSEAVVLALPDPAGGSRLVACVAGAQVPPVPELRTLLKRRLPEHMVPAGFVMLPSLPLTPNGKVDRKALARLEPTAERRGEAAAPRTPVEEGLAAIFGALLDVAAVGPEDDFFGLGGHSLLAMRLMAEIRHAFGVDLAVRTVFEAPTVAGLALLVEAAGGVAPAGATAGAAWEGPVPLSYGQSRLWFLDQLEPGSAAYNIASPLRLEGRLDPGALAAALREIVRRHAVLRTTYAADAQGRPYQAIAPELDPGLPRIDLAALPAAARAAETARRIDDDANRPFDLARGPVLRLALLRLGGEEHVLLLTVHHIAYDAWSHEILLRELAALYAAAAAGRPSPLPEVPFQFADYAIHRHREVEGGALAGQLERWRRRLAGAPTVLELPADHPRPAAQSLRGELRTARWPEPAGLRELTRGERVTPFMLMLATFSALLQRYTGGDDLLVGTPVANRGRRETQELIGFFINTLALRAEMAGDPPFRELLRGVREVALEAYANQDLPFDVLVDELHPERELSRSPLVQVLLSVEAAGGEPPRLPGLRLSPIPFDVRQAKFDLSLTVVEEGGALSAYAEYALDLFAPATVDRLLGHFARLLGGAVTAPEARLSELSLLAPEELQQLTWEWAESAEIVAPDAPGLPPMHERIAGIAARRPDAVAVAAGAERLTYGELVSRAGRLAGVLAAHGVGLESRVGIFAERSAELFVAILAVHKAGGAYVPLDPSYPRDRLAYMMADALPALVLAQPHLRHRLPVSPVDVPVLVLDGAELPVETAPVAARPAAANAAYVLYTSGSTGRPKGVVVSHGSLAASCRAWEPVWGPGGPPRVALQAAGFAFDVFAGETFRTLGTGGTLVVCPPELLGDPAALLRFLHAEEIESADLVPAVLRLLMDHLEAAGELLSAPALLVVGSDSWRVDEYERGRRLCAPGVRLLNAYGVTEATIDTTWFEAPAGPAAIAGNGAVPIGRPFAGSRVHVLDGGGGPAPAGVPGELAIGGAGVARGYHDRPGLTAERFVPDPFAAEPGSRLYRTGDLARWLPDGNLQFLGRTDHQIKIRGFRIEPGEVEAAVARLAGVREAVVIAREDVPGDRRLVAYVVPAGDEEPDAGELRRALLAELPEPMVPSAVVVLPALPLSPNGKVDRRALPRPEPDAGSPGRDTAFAAPQGPLEEMLAAIWREVLGRERVGRDDRFFDLGGHSLLAIQVVSRLRAATGVELPVRSVFEEPTVALLAARVAAMLAGAQGPRPAQPTPFSGLAPGEERPPLSFAQSRLWFLDQLEPGSAAYNVPLPLHVAGPLDAAALAAALREIVRRHAVLRTTYAAGAEGEPYQVIAPAAPGLPLIDLSVLPAAARESETARWIDADAHRPFDLAAGPVLRLALLRLAAAEHLLLLSVHHIAFDGWSQGVLLAELAALYDALTAGEPSPLPELPIQYADFAAWQHRELADGALSGQLDYWRRRLAGAPTVLELPVDPSRDPLPAGPRGEQRTAAVPVPATALQALARGADSSPFMLMLAAFAALLQRYTGQDDLLVGSPVANRDRRETEGLIGLFVNTLVLRLELGGDPGFGELLRRTRETALEAYANQDLPFDLLVNELRPERGPLRSPLVQAVLAVEPERGELPHPRGLRLAEADCDLGLAKFDLTLAVAEAGDRVMVAAEYPAGLFEPATVERLLGHFGNLLRAAVESPAARLSELPWLTPEERRQLDARIAERASRPAAEAERVFRLPSGPLEEELAGLWREVLGCERVGAEDSFFDLGGHSLLAVRLVLEIRKRLGINLPVRAIFDAPTVAGLARAIAAVAAPGSAAVPAGKLEPKPEPLPASGPPPLSFSQSRLWFLDQLDPGSTAYNLPIPLRLEGALDAAVLAAALREIVRRHAVLRTAFAAGEDGEPYQAISPATPAAPATETELPLVDLSALPAAARESEAGRWIEADADRPFDLARGPVLRLALLRLAEREHLLLLSVHHIAFDGWSQGVLLAELAALYDAGAAGEPSPLPELPIQYADFAAWQRRQAAGGALSGQLDYWRRRLADAPTVLELPADHPRPARQSFRGGDRAAAVPVAAGVLQALARGRDATPFILALAAFAALLQRYTGRDDLLVGSPIANRNRGETEGLIGFFVNTLVLRLDLTGDPGFGELLLRARGTALDAYEHQDVPFDLLVDELKPERDPSHPPLIQVVLLVGTEEREPPRPRGLRLTPIEAGGEPAKVDLALAVVEAGERLAATATYRTDLFETATVDRLLAHFGNLLAAAAASPAAPLSALPMLSPAERHQIRQEWNDTAAEPPLRHRRPVHERFASLAASDPAAVAVVHRGERITRGELEAWAGRLARRLRRLGVGPEVPVAVAAERSAGMLAGLLAVLKAGGVYVPLDPAYPLERLAFMLADCAAPVLLAESRLLPALPPFGGAVLSLDDRDGRDDLDDAENRESAEPFTPVDLDALAYVIYTSGSTGRPKGVQVAHRGLVNLVAAQIPLFDLGPGRRALQFASFSFDASVSEIFTALLSGAELHLAGREELLLGGAFARLVRERRITTLTLTPSALAAFTAAVPGERLESLSTLVVAGEACPPDLAARWSRGRRFVNAYGPTEATVCASAEVGYRGGVPSLGRALANTRLGVVDAGLRPVPLGAEGEIVIAGVGLARGYLGQPGLTAERFVPDAAAAEPGARVYRTGDRGRFLPDGRLAFLGRVDQQLKIRGFRIEPGEVEAALLRLPEVSEAAVVARRFAPGDRRLVAFVVPAAARPALAPAPVELRRALLAVLPEHLVPSGFVILEALPLSPAGKLDRKALEREGPLPAGGAEAGAAPRTAVEEVLAGLWAEVLGVAAVGRDDSFFDLGGHSLLAARVVSQVRNVFGVELPLRRLFEAPTVAGLAAAIEEARSGGHSLSAPPVTPVPREGTLPASSAQGRLWFLDQLTPGSTVYNVPFPLRLAGPLNEPALAAALSGVVRRHEALRTTFTAVDGEPRQVIAPAAPFPLPCVDLSGLPAAARPGEARRLLEAEAGRPFDLAAGPLLRTSLLRLEAEESWLLSTVHHIVSDGWSIEILLRELAALYDAGAAGRLSPLPELPVQYADYAAWQQRWMAGEALASQIGYWRHQLAGVPPSLDLPADRPRPAAPSYRGAVLGRELPAGLTAGLRALARRQGATPFMLALAAVDALLFRYTRQEDLTVGTVVAGRDRAEIEGLIGFFVNTLVLRAEVTGDLPFAALLARARETALAAYTHRDVPFETLVEELHPERDLSRTPFFQVLLNVQTVSVEAASRPGLRFELLAAEAATAKFDLSVGVDDAGPSMVLSVEYSTDLFAAPTVERLLGHLERLLGGVAAAPGSAVLDLPLLSEAEEQQLLAEWNDTAVAPSPGACLHDLFAVQAARAPGRTALIAQDGRRLTYGELDAATALLARRLRALGVGPEVLAGVMLDRTAELVVALLAVLRAGGAYVPIDPAYPRQRVDFLLENSGAAVLLTRRALLADYAGSLPAAAPTLFLDAGWEEEPEPQGVVAPLAPVPGNLAYVIYTSGSTGTPKGVALEHRGAVAFARWALEVFPPADLACVLAAASVCFDLSVFEIFVTLAAGGTVALAENALALPEHPAAAEVTLVNTVPSAMAELVRSGRVPAAVRTVTLAGEALKGSLVQAVYERTPARRVLNLYGPSEDTTYSTFTLVPPDAAQPAIGRPVAGTRAYVLDAALRPVPAGVPGELHLAGDGLARGYLRRPELTADRFIPDPYGPPGSRLYRTGDLARFRPDAELDFLGRLDHQVKVRGFRIELGEVEAALARESAVRESAVLALPEPDGEGSRLVAFVVPAAEPPAAGLAAALRAALQAGLPASMVPTAFVFLPALPLTPNGKLDRGALERAASAAGTAGVPGEGEAAGPRTPVEEVLAGIWAQVFGRTVGMHDNFFDLGGHSLLAVRVASRVRAALDVELPVSGLFAAPTLAGLAVLVEREIAGRRGLPLPPVTPALRPHEAAELPLSFAQQRLWLLDSVEPGNTAFNLPAPLRLRGDLDPAAFARALAAVVERHESLRTVFMDREGKPAQVVRPAGPVALAVADLSGLPAAAREEAALTAADLEARQPFDLTHGPLMRTALLRLAPDDHVLLVTWHHIATDGLSLAVFIRELLALYAGAPLAGPPLQYADFAVWQRRHLDGEALAALLGRFKERFGTDLPVLRLPTDRPRPPIQTNPGGNLDAELPPELAAAARRLSRTSGVTLFMTLLAAFQALLARYTGQERIVVGSPVAGRNRAELEGVIGFFVNTLVLPGDLGGDPSFAELLDRTRDMALTAYACQDLPFEKLVEALQPERDRSRSPLFQVMFILQNDSGDEPAAGGGLALEPFPVSTGTAQFDLTLYMAETPEGLRAGVEYNTDLFTAATIERLLTHYQALLAAALANPQARLSELPPAAAVPEVAAALPEAPAPAADVRGDRRDRLAARTSKLSPAQREAMEKRLRGTAPEITPAASPARCLVEITPASASGRPPFFCVHPAGGDVLCFFPLARHVGADQPFFGFQARGLEDGGEPFATLEEMAAHYVAEMRRVQPVGPYRLGGWSFGGLAAFEMARQLAAAGQEVALLAVIDTGPGVPPDDSGAAPPPNDDVYWLVTIAEYVKGLRGADLGFSAAELAPLAPEERLRLFVDRLRAAGVVHAGEDGLAQLRRLLRVYQTNAGGYLSYRARPYPGPVTLFRAADAGFDPGLGADLGWGRLILGAVDLHEVPGDHITLLAEPHVAVLAGRLRACLNGRIL